LTFVGCVITNYAVSFACPGLSIGEYGSIDTFQKLFDRVFNQVKYIFLCALGWEDIVEFHVGVISWSSDLEGIILDMD